MKEANRKIEQLINTSSGVAPHQQKLVHEYAD